ncbi:hypothetical protein Taro_017166, partial [Colocasia esculenta]|nr:hypothetical protein [Colocasia esculenta]
LPVKLDMARYKCYVVWVGRRPGVYYTWFECYEQVNSYPGARYKGFAIVEEGNMAFRGIIMRQTSSANDTVPFQAPSVVHETQPREAEERVVYRDVLAMFLYAMGHGVATGAMCEHFQHSSKTINYHVNRVIKAIALFRFTYIVLPSGTDPVHPRIRHDDRFYPYFKVFAHVVRLGGPAVGPKALTGSLPVNAIGKFGQTELGQALLGQEGLLWSSLGRFGLLEEVLVHSHREDVAWSGGDVVPCSVCVFFVKLDLSSVTAILRGSSCVVLSGLDTSVMNQ